MGSGKSTVARMLERRGAVVFDADYLARRAVDPGTPGYAGVVERFGKGVLTPTGTIDRHQLAHRVFMDPLARRELEAIVHPEVFRMLNDGLGPLRPTDHVVVFDAALIVETGFDEACDVVVVVTAPEGARVGRVVEDGRFSEPDVRARIAAQTTEEVMESRADAVVHNDGSMEDLERQVDMLWGDLRSRAKA
jgi:dephospho-CoA kinase